MEKIALKEVCEIKSGRGFKEGINLNDDGIYVVQMSDVSGNKKEIEWSDVIKADVQLRTHKSLENGDIIFLAKGKTYKAIVVADLVGKAVTTHHFFVITTNEQIEPEYLAMLLNSSSAQDYLEQNASGGSKKHITKQTLGELSIGLCDRRIQMRLVELVIDIDALVQKVNIDYQRLNSVVDSCYQGDHMKSVGELESFMAEPEETIFDDLMPVLHSAITESGLNTDIKPPKRKRKKL